VKYSDLQLLESQGKVLQSDFPRQPDSVLFHLEKMGKESGVAPHSRGCSSGNAWLTMKFPIVDQILQLFRAEAPASALLRRFEKRREALQQQFFHQAAGAGIPRGLRWVRCEWLPTRSLLRDRANRQICLLAGVNISFEAIEGGDMENVAAVSLIRDASAVFQLTRDGWQTTGRALFNMNPAEAEEKLAASYEPYERKLT
jgi:hypothetical protein